MSTIVQRFVRADDLTSERGWRLIEWCIERGGDEFSFRAMGLGKSPTSDLALINTLTPFRRGTPKRESMTMLPGEAARRPTITWRLSAESVAALRQHIADGLFASPSYSTGGWVEDFTIYRRGEIMLGAVSHEEQIVLRLTEREHKEFSALGIESHDTAI